MWMPPGLWAKLKTQGKGPRELQPRPSENATAHYHTCCAAGDRRATERLRMGV